MSYENAPATELVATHCAVCGRPLVDAKSVEIGIGPDCRQKYGYDLAVDDAARDRANRLVYQIAARQEGLDVALAAEELRQLGFDRLAHRVLTRACPVRLVEARDERTGEDTLHVATPYSDAAVGTWRTIRGRYWRKSDKVNVVPARERAALWALLRRHFPGTIAYGPKGPFRIPEAA